MRHAHQQSKIISHHIDSKFGCNNDNITVINEMAKMKNRNIEVTHPELHSIMSRYKGLITYLVYGTISSGYYGRSSCKCGD